MGLQLEIPPPPGHRGCAGSERESHLQQPGTEGSLTAILHLWQWQLQQQQRQQPQHRFGASVSLEPSPANHGPASVTGAAAAPKLSLPPSLLPCCSQRQTPSMLPVRLPAPRVHSTNHRAVLAAAAAAAAVSPRTAAAAALVAPAPSDAPAGAYTAPRATTTSAQRALHCAARPQRDRRSRPRRSPRARRRRRRPPREPSLHRDGAIRGGGGRVQFDAVYSAHHCPLRCSRAPATSGATSQVSGRAPPEPPSCADAVHQGSA